ncbi:hypothetical protein pb186bvf_006462 [Paramecium bursaria]
MMFGDVQTKYVILQMKNSKTNIKRNDYVILNYWIHDRLSFYFPQFQNLIKISVLKSNKFWRKIYNYCMTVKEFDDQFQFMRTIGLSEILLLYGRSFFNQHYSVFIHQKAFILCFYYDFRENYFLKSQMVFYWNKNYSMGQQTLKINQYICRVYPVNLFIFKSVIFLHRNEKQKIP